MLSEAYGWRVLTDDANFGEVDAGGVRIMLSSSARSVSNGSPHSGQNFGGLVGSFGSQPHLSHLYFIVPGFFAPHSEQNLPVLTAPQEQVHLPSSGFFAPHSGQNLPLAEAPHFGHFHVPAAGAVGAACCWAGC